MGIMLLKHLCFRPKNTSSPRKQSPTVIEELCHKFSLADLIKSTNNFDNSQKIGCGGYGIVYKGCIEYNGATDYTIALKRLSRSSEVSCQGFKKEIELLCQLHHPSLLSIIGFCDQEGEKIIVYEYMSNGSLDRHLNSSDVEPLSWKKRLEICVGVARGLHYLHTGAKRTIFHGDIKPSNILLDDNMAPKLGDLGLSFVGPRYMSKPKPIQVDRITGTFGYMAPEYSCQGILSDKCDIYSFGMVLLQVVSAKGKQLIEYEKKSIVYPSAVVGVLDFVQRFPVEEIIDPILTGKIAPACWEVLINVIEKCLKTEPNERPTIVEVEVELEHALKLQEEADARKPSGDYILLSNTIFTQVGFGLENDSNVNESGYASESDHLI